MASGTFSTTFGTYYRLQMEWTATQSVANNTSTVTAKLYLISLSSRSSISSSSSKTFRITIDGTASSTTGNLNLSGGQKKLLHTYSKVVPHGSNGAKSVPIVGFMQWGLSINGHTSDVTISKTEALPTIVSASSISTVSSWRAGESLSVTINRASSAYTHTVRAYVGSTMVATRTGVGASVVFNFSTAELNTIFITIGTHTASVASVEVDTYSGSTKIGSTDTHNFDITAGLPTDKISFPSGTNYTVGDAITFNLTPYNSRFYHTVILRYAGEEIARTEMTPGETLGVINTGTSAIMNDLHSKIGYADYANFTLEFYSKWVNQVIRQPVEKTIRFYPDLSSLSPTFDAELDVTDTNTTIRNILGADYYLSGKSTIQITVPSAQKATAQGSEVITQYTFSVGNKTVTVPNTPGSIVATIPGVVASGYTTITATAQDTRGAEASVYWSGTFIPYFDLIVGASASRVGRFETTTNLEVTTKYAPVIKTSSPLNSLVSRRYRYRQRNGAWGGWITLSAIATVATASLSLDNTKSWDIEVEVTDRFGTKTTQTIYVSAGKPTLFIDALRNSVGVNKFPDKSNAFQVEGDVIATGYGQFNDVKIGTYANDMYKSGAKLLLSAQSDVTDFHKGAFTMRPYLYDVTFSTNKGKFYFSDPITAPSGITADVTGNLSGNVTSSGTSTFNYTMFNDQPITSYLETGFCGIQMDGATPFGIGVGVNFKMSKNYTPTSITLSQDSGNIATSKVFTGYITKHGFWIQIVRSNATTNTAWRGTYRA